LFQHTDTDTGLFARVRALIERLIAGVRELFGTIIKSVVGFCGGGRI
jgi:hypothetical protein